MRWLSVVLALLLAGCASGSTGVGERGPGTPAARPPSVPGHPPGLTARMVLPSTTMAAGSSMTGHVLIDNNTGRAVHASGCLGLFAVVLSSPTYRPAVAWASCLQRFTIPVGQTRYRVTISASYSQCSQGRPQGGQKACLRGGHMPPLPPGTYHARLYQLAKLVRVPLPVTVRVTPGRR